MRTFTTTHTVYNFDELTKEAQQKAIENQRQFEYEVGLDHWLSDFMHEQAGELMKKYGFKSENASVFYSLSNCQGDGAMMTGDFSYKGYTFSVKHYGHYYHYNSKTIDEITRNNGNEISDATWSKMFNEFEPKYVELCKELERAGYAAIDEATSDAELIETIKANEYEFNADGSMA